MAFRLVFEQQGSGAPLILIHGMAGDRHTWDGVFPALARTRRVIRYDLRGFGESVDGADESYSHSDDLLQLMDARDIEACDLLGVSMGGSIALHFALENPVRVKRLVLESPAMMGWDWSPDWRALWSELERAAKERGCDPARALWIKHPMFSTLRAHPRAFEAFSQSVARYSCRHWIERDRHRPLAAPDLERLHELQAATLLITGARDLEDFRLIAEAIASMAARVSRVDVADAGHLVHLERPDAFLRAVEAFLV